MGGGRERGREGNDAIRCKRPFRAVRTLECVIGGLVAKTNPVWPHCREMKSHFKRRLRDRRLAGDFAHDERTDHVEDVDCGHARGNGCEHGARANEQGKEHARWRMRDHVAGAQGDG